MIFLILSRRSKPTFPVIEIGGFFMFFKQKYSLDDTKEFERTGFSRFCEILTTDCINVFKLNLMTLFASLPIVTLPPALCAMHAVIRKMMNDEAVSCFSDFRDAFSAYWKQSYVVFLLGTVLPVFTLAASLYYAQAATAVPLYFLSCALSLFVFVASMMASGYLFPLLTMGYPLTQAIRHSFFLGLSKPLRALLCSIFYLGMLAAAIAFIPLSLPYLVLIGLSVPCFIGQFFIRLPLNQIAAAREQE